MKMFTLKECSEFLQVSVLTIRRMITNKQFCKTKRIGGQIRVLDTDFLHWVECQEDVITEYDNIKNRRFLNKIDMKRRQL